MAFPGIDIYEEGHFFVFVLAEIVKAILRFEALKKTFFVEIKVALHGKAVML